MILNKKHVIFDWNGTLIDDAWIFVDILNALLIKRNLNQIHLNDYQELFCFPLINFYQNNGDLKEESDIYKKYSDIFSSETPISSESPISSRFSLLCFFHLLYK